MNEPAIGYRIRRLRKEKRMTQVQLAKAIEVSSRQVIQWEMGHTFAPSQENISKLAKVFGVTASYLYTGEVATEEMLDEIGHEISKRRSRFASDDEIVSIRMPLSVEKRLHRAAAGDGMSVGSFIDYLLDLYEKEKVNGKSKEE